MLLKYFSLYFCVIIGQVCCCPKQTTTSTTTPRTRPTPRTYTPLPWFNVTDAPVESATLNSHKRWNYPNCPEYFERCVKTLIDFKVLKGFTHIKLWLTGKHSLIWIKRIKSYEFENVFLSIYNQVMGLSFLMEYSSKLVSFRLMMIIWNNPLDIFCIQKIP